MSLTSHIAQLQRRHNALKREIEQEKQHPATSKVRLAELKRKKLLLKDEIVKLSPAQPLETVH